MLQLSEEKNVRLDTMRSTDVFVNDTEWSSLTVHLEGCSQLRLKQYLNRPLSINRLESSPSCLFFDFNEMQHSGVQLTELLMH